MQLVETNSATKSRVNISGVGPRLRSTPSATTTIRSAMTLAVLCILVVARPAQAQTESVLYNFTGGADGSTPQGKLTFHGGNLYGTTWGGGLGSGTVFELSPNGTEAGQRPCSITSARLRTARTERIQLIPM